jgi:glucose/arabinose dehydrogenase
VTIYREPRAIFCCYACGTTDAFNMRLRNWRTPTLVLVCLTTSMSLASCGNTEVVSTSTIETSSQELSLEKIAMLDQPVDAASRENENAIYFVGRLGKIFRYSDNTMESTPVLDITDLTYGEGERGLLGLAFSPDGTTAYINYTDLNNDTTIARITVANDGAFIRETLSTILVIEQPFENHNAGDIVVEPSGMLLVPTGDGGSRDDPLRVSLDDSSPLGKVLRVNPLDGSYTILARGLRNPWRVDLYDDRLWLADVGQNSFEEVSVLDGVQQFSGSQVIDFGWSAYEANDRFNTDQTSVAHVPPVIAYPHGDDGCSISGGAVAETGSLINRYVFGDYCSGKVWSVPINETSPKVTLHFDDIDSPTAIVRANKKLFVLSLNGDIWQIRG